MDFLEYVKNNNCEKWKLYYNGFDLSLKVKDGTKIAATTAFDLYNGKYMPSVGEKKAILDKDDNIICIIELTKIDIKEFKLVDEIYAQKDGFNSLTAWREAHYYFFKEYLDKINVEFNEKSKLILMEFKVIFK